MAKKALLQGNAGNYRIRGTIWELGSFAYRAYVHLIPTVARSIPPRWVVSADGMTLQEVLGAAKARVRSTVGTPVNTLELVPKTAPTPQPDTEHLAPRRRVPRRFPPMRKAEKQPSVYVVYPAALFDGWEVVKERDDNPAFFNTRDEAISYSKARAVMDGGAVVKLENWFGDTERVWEVEPEPQPRLLALSTS